MQHESIKPKKCLITLKMNKIFEDFIQDFSLLDGLISKISNELREQLIFVNIHRATPISYSVDHHFVIKKAKMHPTSNRSNLVTLALSRSSQLGLSFGKIFQNFALTSITFVQFCYF